jgi:phosphoglycerate dehydrogenase-like enzyme
MLAKLPHLAVVQLLTAGVDRWIEVVPEGVILCNGRGIHGASTAELAVAGLLSIIREMPTFLDRQRARQWQRASSDSLAEKHVLVLGAGDIGDRIAAVARTLDAEVTVIARRARAGVRSMDDLPELLPDADVVVLALPHTNETEGLVDAGFLAALRDRAVLVNIARGPLVDTDALVAELGSGRLRAFLDVTDPEPLPADHPLWGVPGLVLTPHVGGGTTGWGRRGYRLVREQLERYVDGGELINKVEAGY